MGRVARWIDAQSAEAKDRIISHLDPTFDGAKWWSEDRDCGCLVGCAMVDRNATPAGEREYWLWGARMSRETEWVGGRFPDLTHRFTPERMWRLVKARAAKANRVEIPAVAEEAALA